MARHYRAGTVIVTSADVRTSAEVTVVDGLIADVSSVRPHELEEHERRSVLAPGWLNAHAHLDLGALAGRVPAGAAFTDWVGALLGERARLSPEALQDGARASAAELFSSGTRVVLDIDSLDIARDALRNTERTEPRHLQAPNVRSFVEVLDAAPDFPDERTAGALERACAAIARGDALSPHGPHTAGDRLLEELGRLASSGFKGAGRRVVHWAESPEEVEWMLEGRGPFEPLLGPSPRTTGLERLARFGLLDGTLLIHGNLPQPTEIELLRSARDVAVVHCPGCHEFFGRAPFPIDIYREAGVAVLLGTDSGASNAALDMGREVRLARAKLGVSPVEAFDAATSAVARWLGEPTVTGTLEPGSRGDLVRYSDEEPDPAHVLERLTRGALEPCAL